MSTDLGVLGLEYPPIDMTFTWPGMHGESFRVSPDASDIAAIAFVEAAALIDKDDTASAVMLAKSALKPFVHEDDYDRLIAVGLAKRQSLNDLLRLYRSLVEAVARFPTTQPSDSSDGQSSTVPKSMDVYSQAVVMAMGASEGRPDIKRIIYQTYQERMAAKATA
jgi:hypothetical protein